MENAVETPTVLLVFWEIRDFPLCKVKVGESIRSRHFMATNLFNSMWTLQIFPKLKVNGLFCAVCSLQNCSDIIQGPNPVCVEVEFELLIPGFRFMKSDTHSITDQILNTYNCEIPDLYFRIRQSRIDNLMIKCTLRNLSRNRGLFEYRIRHLFTRLDVIEFNEDIHILYADCIEDWKSPKVVHGQYYESSYKFHRVDDYLNIDAKISPFQNWNFSMVKLEISLLDGNRTEFIRKRRILPVLTGNMYFKIKNFIKICSVKKKLDTVKNRVITFKCKLFGHTGIICNEII